MALIHLTSDLTWTGTYSQNTTTPYAQTNVSNTVQPPAVNYMDNTNHIGFTTFESELGPSRFTGVEGEPGTMTYTYTGVKGLGSLTIENNFDDIDATGFTSNMYPIGGPKKDSQFLGIAGEIGAMSYNHAGPEELGVLNLEGVNYFPNLNATGFTSNMFPIGGPKKESQYIGIAGAQGSETYSYPNNAELNLGDLTKNIREGAGDFESYTPSVGNYGTKFVYDGDSTLIVSAPNAQGFDTYGESIINHVMSTPSKDDFAIDDVSFSNRGIAKRKSQLGQGSKFPISYTGNLHSFDIARTGFHPDSKYEDIFGNQVNDGDNTNAGLANTYIIESPIDDMYNKYNLRDDATPNPGYAKQPFILRGIQREGSIDPQRWGLENTKGGKISSTFGIPRAGILAAGERAAIDVARISKFLISPRGIGFLVRQFGYQLMNPNTENVTGNAKGFPLTQLYNPLSSPVQAIAGIIGMHTKRHGIPIVGGSEYGRVKSNQIEFQKLDGMDFKGSRLLLLARQSFPGKNPRTPPELPDAANQAESQRNLEKLPGLGQVDLGMPFPALSAAKGPGSVFGIGRTNIRRYTDTSLKAQRSSTAYSAQMLPARNSPDGGEPKPAASENGNGEEQPKEKMPLGVLDENKFRYKDDVAPAGEEAGGLVWPNAYGGYRGQESSPFTVDEIDDGENRKDKTWPRHEDESGTPHVAGHNSLKKELERSLKQKSSDTEPRMPSLLANSAGDVGQLRSYITTAYGAIPNKSPGDSNTFVDFRQLARDGLSDQYNPRKKIGNESYSPREFYSTDVKGAKEHNRPDPINSMARKNVYKSSDETVEPAKDLIKFQFVRLGLNQNISDAFDKDENHIIFRAYLSDLSDSFAPTWTPSLDQGRGDAKILYSSFDRTISVSFTIPMLSAVDYNGVWTKINDLARLTMPNYKGSDGFTGNYVAVTIGNLYTAQPMYIQSLDYAWDSETPWETTNGFQVPHYTTCDMTLGYIGKNRPSVKINAYDTFANQSTHKGSLDKNSDLGSAFEDPDGMPDKIFEKYYDQAVTEKDHHYYEFFDTIAFDHFKKGLELQRSVAELQQKKIVPPPITFRKPK